MNVELCEWSAPTPVLWQEHLHQNNTGTRYSSKLEDFETFLENARKYPTLPAGGESKAKVLLVDDLPLVNGDEKRRQLCKLLSYLAAGGKFPTVIVFTDTAEDFHHGKSINRVTGDILQALETGGATKITFNPVTANATKRVLEKLLKLERYQLPGEVVSEVARVSGGDIRHATLLIQYTCLNRRRGLEKTPAKRRRSLSGKQQASSAGDEDCSKEQSNCGRDQVLSLFHALGKFLHNKRVVEGSSESAEELCGPLREEFRRKPSQVDNPEIIISQSHAESSTLLAFFHENLLDFVDDESIEDAAEVLEYLSDADSIGAKFSWQSRHSNSSQLCESAAASVAARGVLFGNTHPAPRRWQTLRSPVLWQVDRSRSSKKVEIFSSLKESNRGAMVHATEYLPFQRSIYFFRGAPRANLSATKTVECEDEIEEW